MSNIEDENISNLDKSLSYATFDDTGANVSRTSHVKKSSELSSPNVNLCSESMIKDLSSNGTNKIKGEINQICNHRKNLTDSIPEVKHQLEQQLTKIFKQQHSIDSSISIKSADVPDLEVFSAHPCYSQITNNLPFLLPSNPISPRSGAIQTSYEMLLNTFLF